MTKTIYCPSCDNRASAWDDVHFEMRGQHHGRVVLKCLRCGAGIYVRLMRRSSVIPAPLWAKMQETWETELGVPTTDDKSDQEDESVHGDEITDSIVIAKLTEETAELVGWAYAQADRRGIPRALAREVLNVNDVQDGIYTANQILSFYEDSLPGRWDQLQTEGVTTEDIERFWGRPEWLRFYLMELNALERRLMTGAFAENVADSEEVAIQVRQNLPSFGVEPPTVESPDRPLPWELYDRVMDYLDAHGGNQSGRSDGEFLRFLDGSTSMNATVRRLVVAGLL